MEGAVCNNKAQNLKTREAKRKEGWSPHRHADTEPLWSSPSHLSAELWFHLHIMCRDALHVPDTLCLRLPVLFEFSCFFSWSNEKSKRKGLNGYLMRFYTIWEAQTFFSHRQTSICCHFQDSPSPSHSRSVHLVPSLLSPLMQQAFQIMPPCKRCLWAKLKCGERKLIVSQIVFCDLPAWGPGWLQHADLHAAEMADWYLISDPGEALVMMDVYLMGLRFQPR